MKDIILIGGGSHCKSVIDTLLNLPQWNIVGILDKKDKVGNIINSIEIIGEDKDLPSFYQKGISYAFITVGGTGDNTLRKKLYNYTKKLGFTFPKIIDPTAIVSENVRIGEGSFIGKGAIINTDVEIGNNCIINTGSIIEHDGKIECHSHIAPGSTLSGNVFIGEGSHIGTNSTIIQDITIGKNTLIGAGSVVVKDIGNNKKAYGNPCKVVL